MISLSKVAEVLEATANYVEGIESKKIAEETAIKTKTASELATKLVEVTGEPLDNSLVEKFANLDPAIAQFLEKMAGTVEPVDSLGGADTRTKTASARSNAEDSFLNWVTGP